MLRLVAAVERPPCAPATAAAGPAGPVDDVVRPVGDELCVDAEDTLQSRLRSARGVEPDTESTHRVGDELPPERGHVGHGRDTNRRTGITHHSTERSLDAERIRDALLDGELRFASSVEAIHPKAIESDVDVAEQHRLHVRRARPENHADIGARMSDHRLIWSFAPSAAGPHLEN